MVKIVYAEKLKSSMPLSANLFRLESSIEKHAVSKGAALVGDA